MVPIMGSFNSHSRQHNVNYEFNPESKKFPVFASEIIKKVAELHYRSRLLALAHHDFDGDACNVLKSAVGALRMSNDDEPLSLERGNYGLQYRELVWVWRWYG